MISFFRNLTGSTLNRASAATAVAVVVAQLFATWLNLCGTSPESLTALAIGFAVGVILLRWISTRIAVVLTDRRFGHQVFSMGLLVIGMSWATPVALNSTLLAGCETVGATWLVAPVLTMLFPAFVVALLTVAAGAFFQLSTRQHETPWIESMLSGAPGIVVLLIPVWLGISPMPLAAFVTVMITLACGCSLLKVKSDQNCNELTSRYDAAGFVPDRRARFPFVISFAAAGVLMVAVAEILCRLIPAGLPLLIQSVCITAIALYFLTRPLTMKLLRSSVMQFLAVLTLALLPLLFVPLAGLNLAINTGRLPGFSVLLLDSVQYAVFAAAAFVPVLCMLQTTPRPLSCCSAVVPFVIGAVSALTAVSLGILPTMILAVGIMVSASVSLLHVPLKNREGSAAGIRFSMSRTYALPALSLLCAALTGFGSIETSRTSSLLFSERTAAAMQRGIAQELIAQSHVNRLMTTVPTSLGEVTVWQRTGDVLEFQRNGMPVGRVSTDTDVSPQPIEDILPAILPLACHAQPHRVLVLGDDTGVCLQVCTHFPVQEIVAVRNDAGMTELAQKLAGRFPILSPDQDERVQILHEPAVLALRRRELKSFDVVISSGEAFGLPAALSQFTAEYYRAARSRMTHDAVFCQRFRQSDPGPEPLKETLATMMTAFINVGVIQTMPGELLLLASDSDEGLIDPGFLSRLQREHVRREIATAGWDWAQVAILPLLDAHDPIGMFSQEPPPHPISGSNCGLALRQPYESARRANKSSELHAAFGPHQTQLLAAIPAGEDHQEVKRRLNALSQQLEILAGMPDQPWTYRKSLQMEMKQSARPQRDVIERGLITKVAHPLDVLRQRYLVSLGQALSAARRGELNPAIIKGLDTYTDNFEPLITNFAHYEIVRLHELSEHQAPADEFQHRLHIVFYTSPVDASVRPVIFAMRQLVDNPSLIADDIRRYDMLNSLLQKMIERWEARTAWEPRSALRVQNDVDLSVGVANRAMAQMEEICSSAAVDQAEFYLRRRFVNAALIKPLRDYRDQVLAHRMKSEIPVEQNTEDPHDLPLLIDADSGLNTN